MIYSKLFHVIPMTWGGIVCHTDEILPRAESSSDGLLKLRCQGILTTLHRSYYIHSSHLVMLPPLGTGGIMFSGCPSIRPKPEIPLTTSTWVRWSVRPTVTVLRHVRPSVRLSVRLERSPGICQRTHGANGLKFCMLLYLGHFQN